MINIYVGNLPFRTTESDLQTMFAEFGNVERASIVTDRETGRSRGFGFVEMSERADGEQAIEGLNGKEFGGRTLTVNEAKPREPRAGGGHGGGGGGGRSGGGYSRRENRGGGGDWR